MRGTVFAERLRAPGRLRLAAGGFPVPGLLACALLLPLSALSDPAGSPPPSNPSARETLLIPGVANTLGTHAARWRSDLVLRNPGRDPIEVRVYFLKAGAPGELDSLPHRDYFLVAGETKELRGVLGSEFGISGTGALLVTAARTFFPNNPADAAVAGWVRTYVASLYAQGGDVGGAIPSAELVDTASQVVYGLRHDGTSEKGVRAAVGLVNPSTVHGVTVRVDYVDEAGEVLSSSELYVPPLSTMQQPVPVRLGRAVARFTRVDGTGPFVAYATMVDNATQDSTFIYGSAEPGKPALPHQLVLTP